MRRIEIAKNSFFYECYLNKYLEDCQEIENLINNLDSIQKEIIFFMEQRFNNIALFSNYTLKDFQTKSIGRYLKFHKAFYVTPIERLFIVKLKDLRNIREQIYIAKRKLKKLKEHKVNEKQFRFITENTNRIMLDHAIETGGYYSIQNDLGFFAVSKKIQRKQVKVINHGETTKLKKAILARGGTLYSETNPHGERFKVFNLDPLFYRLKWFRFSKFLNEPEIINYRFFQARGKHCVARKVFDYIKNNPSVKDLYRNNQ